MTATTSRAPYRVDLPVETPAPNRLADQAWAQYVALRHRYALAPSARIARLHDRASLRYHRRMLRAV